MIDEGLWHYTPSIGADMRILGWWYELVQNGERHLVAEPQQTDTPSDFLQFWRPPRALAFCPKSERLEDGIWFAGWLEPILSGAFVGLWISPKYRTTKAAARVTHDFFDRATQAFPVLIGLTKQARLLPIHRTIGFTHLGTVPRLFDGDDAHVVVLTREGFEHGWKGRARRGHASQLRQLVDRGRAADSSGDPAPSQRGDDAGNRFRRCEAPPEPEAD